MEDEVKLETPVESQTTEAVQTDTAPKVFEIPTEAQDLVGEGKKYKSAEDALRSVPHAQQHIETLESELAATKEELLKRQTTAELLDEIKSGIQPPATTYQEPEFNQDMLQNVVNKTLESKEKERVSQQNAQSVAKTFTDKYGEKAETVYNSMALENGLTIQQLHNLAATNPKLVLKLSELSKPGEILNSKPTSSVNTEALRNQVGDTSKLTSRVKQGATTKDLAAAWKIAGEKIKQQT
jgi:hypothetical protein